MALLERRGEFKLENRLEAIRKTDIIRDPRELNPLQMAYLGDTIHDLYVRTHLVSTGKSVGKMHKDAVTMVSAGAQSEMLLSIEPLLTQEESDIVRRGRNSQAKHAAPKHADPADYSHATALEALWGYLYITGQITRLNELMEAGLNNLCQKQNSK